VQPDNSPAKPIPAVLTNVRLSSNSLLQLQNRSGPNRAEPVRCGMRSHQKR